TRARELLVIPRLPDEATGNRKEGTWKGLVDLGLGDLPALDLSRYSDTFESTFTNEQGAQTTEQFVEEAWAIAARRRELKWLIPSRDEDPGQPLLREAESAGPFAGDASGSVEGRS